MDIKITKFKKIDEEFVTLHPINIFIGANNAGKSSFIQAIQFAISSCQTLELERRSWTKSGTRTSSLDSNDFLYTPTQNIEFLYHGKKLTGAKTRNDRSEMKFSFTDTDNTTTVRISKGKNGGFTTTIDGRKLGARLSDIVNPFCVYVPGIAGIPTREKYEVPITIRKSATRGDSNNYLRNILFSISKNSKKWDSFAKSVNSIYPNVVLTADFDDQLSENIYVNVKVGELELPLDAVGTGLLQVIQIFAYIEYFNPTIILLDEPDSHIHPTKQKLLAKELIKRTIANENLKIVCSTHSRYILEALDMHANVMHFQDGKIYPGVEQASILLDIGAADADYLFRKKKLRYVIATEDKVDDIVEKKKFLRNFLLANGLSEDEFVLHSYEGCKNVHFAKVLEGFVRKHIPTASVLLHIDRDQKIDLDEELLKLRLDCESRKIRLFVTKYQEIESYFCMPDHVSQVFSMSLKEASEKYAEFVSELEDETKNKLTNFVLRDRPKLALDKNNHIDIKIVEQTVNEWYRNYKYELTLGKELVGKFKDYAQKAWKKNPNDISNCSSALISVDFKKLLN